MQISQQVRLGRRHTANTLTAANPTPVVLRRQTWSIHQQLLDGVRSFGFLRGHRHRAHKDTIYRHLCQAEFFRPGTGDQLRSARRRVDAATDGEHRVVMRADLRIGFQQHVFQINPRVMPTRMAVFDHEDHRIIWIGFCDLQRVAHLLRRARLKRDVGETITVQLRKKLCCLLNLGDASGNTHTVKWCARSACFGHHAGLPKLQVPQEAVEEHGVELCGAARLQEANKTVFVLAKLLLGVHATTGKLRPVAGVGGSRHNLTIGRRRRHTAQDDGG